MGADATWPLQQGLVKYLEQDLSLKKHLGKTPKIFDQQEIAKESAKAGCPRVVLGDNFSKAWSSATFEGQEHDLTLHLWTNEGGSRASKEIAGVIIDRLHNADLSPDRRSNSARRGDRRPGSRRPIAECP